MPNPNDPNPNLPNGGVPVVGNESQTGREPNTPSDAPAGNIPTGDTGQPDEATVPGATEDGASETPTAETAKVTFSGSFDAAVDVPVGTTYGEALKKAGGGTWSSTTWKVNGQAVKAGDTVSGNVEVTSVQKASGS